MTFDGFRSRWITPRGVGVGHRLADLLEDREEPRPVVGRAPARRQQRRQGAAPDQLHREERPAVGEAPQLVDRDDARVLELAADLRLLDEPADHLGVVAVLLPEDLDGEVAAEVGVAPLEDRPHAAPGDLADELVARRLARDVGHLGRSGPDQPRVLGGLPEMDARAALDRPAPIGGAEGGGTRSRAVVPTIVGTGRVPEAETPGRIDREGGPQAEQAPGAEPRRRVRRQAGPAVGAGLGADHPHGPRSGPIRHLGPSSRLGFSRRTLQGRAGLQPSRAAKRARISSSTWAASPTVAAISSRSSRP